MACFVCNKNLDGWEEGDEAWLEHVKHAPNCPLVRLDIEANRLITFAPEVWPHRSRPSLSAERMAQAGFFYWPRTLSSRAAGQDDTAICFQCGLALDGWEEEDDPRHEHAKRRPECPFVKSGVAIRPCAFEFLLASQPAQNAVRHISARTGLDEAGTHKAQKFQVPQLPAASRRPAPAPRASRKASMLARTENNASKETRPLGSRTSQVSNVSAAATEAVPGARSTDLLSGLESLVDESHLDMTVEAILHLFLQKKLAEYDVQSEAALEQLSIDRIASMV